MMPATCQYNTTLFVVSATSENYDYRSYEYS